jgi:hypothetical protein
MNHSLSLRSSVAVTPVGPCRTPIPAILAAEPLLAASILRRATAELDTLGPAMHQRQLRKSGEWMPLLVTLPGFEVATQGLHGRIRHPLLAPALHATSFTTPAAFFRCHRCPVSHLPWGIHFARAPSRRPNVTRDKTFLEVTGVYPPFTSRGLRSSSTCDRVGNTTGSVPT